ncbi:unnamed protein product, partial [Brachionus calyciflorus]
ITAINLFFSWDLWNRNKLVKKLQHENHLYFYEIERLKHELSQLKFDYERSKSGTNSELVKINKGYIIFRARDLLTTLRKLINNLNRIKPLDDSFQSLFFLNIFNIYKILTDENYGNISNVNNISNGSSQFIFIIYTLNWITLFFSLFIMNQNLSLNDVSDEKIAYLNGENIKASDLLNTE